MQDKYIRSGYRINFSRKRAIMKSLFMKHNETLNVWTHLIGFIIIILFILKLCLQPSFRPEVHNIQQLA